MARRKHTTGYLVAYTRVSTAAQAQSGVSLEAQRRAIREHADVHGLEIAEWFEDAGRSGASISRRPGLLAALAEIEAGRADGLVCAKVDRLGRSAADVAGLVERAHKEGWRLIALDIGLDLGTPAGELVANALGMAARFEWRRISDRQLEKHDELRRQDRPRGRPAVPREVADRIRAMRADGLTLRAIAAELNTERVPTARGGKEWVAATVRSAALTRERELASQAQS